MTIRGVRAWCARFGASQSGNVALIFALVLPVLLLAVAMAVDFGRASTERSRLNDALDSAVLSTAELVGSGNAAGLSAAQINERARIFLLANANGVSASVGPVTMAISGSGSSRRVLGTYQADYRTIFGGGILPVNSIRLAGTAEAGVSTPVFMNFVFVLDNSQSMGLAATAADASRLKSKTGGCEFACHALPTGPNSFYEIARRNGVKLRIDSLINAASDAIETAKQRRIRADQFKFSTLTMASDLVTVGNMTSDLTRATADVNSVRLASVTDAGPGQTYFQTSMGRLPARVPPSGDGETTGTPLSYVILVTDGIYDQVNPTALFGHETGPMNPAWCQPLKDRGVTLIVLYTTYLQIPSREEWTGLVRPHDSRIAPNLQACASPGEFFEADDDAEVQTAMNVIFERVLKTPHLTR